MSVLLVIRPMYLHADQAGMWTTLTARSRARLCELLSKSGSACRIVYHIMPVGPAVIAVKQTGLRETQAKFE